MGQQVKARDDFEVHCYCRMPELKNVGMIECTSCSNGFIWLVVMYPLKF